MYTSWGFRKREIVRSAVVTGVVNIMAKLFLPVVALVLLAATGEPSDWVWPSALIGFVLLVASTVLFTLVLRREGLARQIGSAVSGSASWLRRAVGRAAVPGWGDVAVRFRSQTIDLLRRRWILLTTATLVSQLSVYLVLLVALRVVGTPQSDVGWVQALAAFAIVRLASSVPILPGNVGLAELGYIGALVLVGGQRDAVVAAVLLFRFLTFYAQIPIGAVTYVVWRRNRSWRKGQGERQRPTVLEDGTTGSQAAGSLEAAASR